MILREAAKGAFVGTVYGMFWFNSSAIANLLLVVLMYLHVYADCQSFDAIGTI